MEKCHRKRYLEGNLELDDTSEFTEEFCFYPCFLLGVENLSESTQEVRATHLGLEPFCYIFEILFFGLSGSLQYHSLIDREHIAKEKIHIIDITIGDSGTIREGYQLVCEYRRSILSENLETIKVHKFILIRGPDASIDLNLDIHITLSIREEEEKGRAFADFFSDLAILAQERLDMLEE